VVDRFGLGCRHLGLELLETFGPLAHGQAAILLGDRLERLLELQTVLWFLDRSSGSHWNWKHRGWY
jgi:hypothetical protein